MRGASYRCGVRSQNSRVVVVRGAYMVGINCRGVQRKTKKQLREEIIDIYI